MKHFAPLVLAAVLGLAGPAAAMTIEAPLTCVMNGGRTPVLTNPGPRTVRAGVTVVVTIRSGTRTQTVNHRLTAGLAPGQSASVFNQLLVLDPTQPATCTAVARWFSPADIYAK